MKVLVLWSLAFFVSAATAGVAPPARPTPTLPASVFLGTYPAQWRSWTQKQWAAMPLKMRTGEPPQFKILTGNEMKKLPGLGGQESSGAYDSEKGIIYTRSDLFAYHERFLGHELGHRFYLSGADPKLPTAPKLMTQAQRGEFHAWVRQLTDDPNDGKRENYQLIPQYTYLIQGKKILDRELSHEKFAHAFLQVYFPGGNHPAFGKAHPVVEKKIRSYSAP